MSRKNRPSKPNPSPPPAIQRKSWLPIAAGAFVIVVALIAALAIHSFKKPKKEAEVAITGPVTFSKNIAPIIYQNCSTCHRPGQSGPFDLLSYEDAKKHAKDIARVTADRIMPPWLPVHGYNDFVGERRLSDQQIALIQRWVQEGSGEGNPADAPPAPQFPSGWALGEPDLVVQLQPYTLAAEGKDIYYNFVTPIPTTTTKFVSGVELLPSNRAVHHAFIDVDETSAARRLAAKLSPPGFYGMETPESTKMPGGQLLGWQPGKIAALSTVPWVLRTNTDLVLQVHMNPSGKPEIIQPKLGFHFTDKAPTNSAFRLRLTAFELDIPPGVSNYVAESSYTLPIDLQMVRVGGHAHYLCKEMQGYALLPNGDKKWLLYIKDWDFKWQGDYQYKEPISLPKGSKVYLRFTYDNSTNNIRNPFSPPRRVLWGLSSTDEMGELYFQTMPKDTADYRTLAMDYSRYFAEVSEAFYKHRIRVNPADEEAHQRLGRSFAGKGLMNEAIAELLEALRLNPSDDKAYFDLGSIYLRQGRGAEAYTAFQNTIRLNPEDSQAFGSLGIICLQAGRYDEARQYLQNALSLNPEDALAAQYLQRLNSRR